MYNNELMHIGKNKASLKSKANCYTYPQLKKFIRIVDLNIGCAWIKKRAFIKRHDLKENRCLDMSSMMPKKQKRLMAD